MSPVDILNSMRQRFQFNIVPLTSYYTLIYSHVELYHSYNISTIQQDICVLLNNAPGLGWLIFIAAFQL